MAVRTSGKNALILNDVLVGDVWICSGQSNMQFGVSGAPAVKALIPDSKNIRSFEVKRTVAFTEQADCEGEWVDRHPNSAVAFAFAHALRSAAKVPVGIVLSSWGSSSIEAWMRESQLQAMELPHTSVVNTIDLGDRTTSTQRTSCRLVSASLSSLLAIRSA